MYPTKMQKKSSPYCYRIITNKSLKYILGALLMIAIIFYNVIIDKMSGYNYAFVDERTGDINCNANSFLQPLVSRIGKNNAKPTNSYAPKILCYIMTVEAYHTTRCKAVLDTWGKHCDKLIFASDFTDPSLPGSFEIPETDHTYLALWKKHQSTLRFLQSEGYLEEYDYFFKADDDTFVLMDNLRQFLSSRDVVALNEADIPLQFGRKVRVPSYQIQAMKVDDKALETFTNTIGDWFYASGGAGYVMNAQYVKTLLQVVNEPRCMPHQWDVPEDAAIAFCMAWEGVYTRSGRDSMNRERFHLNNPTITLKGLPGWVGRYQEGLGNPVAGQGCCSSESISFHYMTIEMMHYMYAMTYKCPKMWRTANRRAHS